jgi:ADP-heptose:LPS heptosyltransferase
MRIEASRVSRVLVIGLSCIGDMLFATAALRNLRHFLPDASFTLWAPPRIIGMFEEDPMWNSVELYDRRKDFSGFNGRLKAVQKMRGGKFDLVVDLRATLMPLVSGALYSPLFAVNEFFFPKKIHEVEKWLYFFSSLGVPLLYRNMRLHISSFQKNNVTTFLKEKLKGNPFFVLNPGADSAKRWPWEHYANLGEKLVERYNAYIGVIGYSDQEQKIAASVLEAIGEKGIDLSKKLPLSTLGAWLSCADLVVSNDTGPLHMAAALSVPVVGIYGPSLPQINGPWGTIHRVVIPPVSCAPCIQGEKCKQGVGSCLSRLPIDTVMNACDDVLSESLRDSEK